MKAGNYKDYADFCRQTDWMDPYEVHAAEDAAWDNAWEEFCNSYEEKYGDIGDDWDLLKFLWEDSFDLADETSDAWLLEMSVDDLVKEEMDVKYLYDKYSHEQYDKWHKSKDDKDLPLHFVEWREQFYNTRLDVMIGFNTKQPWVYDNIRDVYIDPPAEVLDSLPNWREDSDKTEEALLEICKTEPDWLLERQFWYGDEDFEI